MQITPEVVEATWRYVQAIAPYLNVPDVESVRIVCNKDQQDMGSWTVLYPLGKPAQYVLRLSIDQTEELEGLIRVVAHEMIHAHQTLEGTCNNAQHNADFTRLWRKMAKQFGWDSKRLV